MSEQAIVRPRWLFCSSWYDCKLFRSHNMCKLVCCESGDVRQCSKPRLAFFTAKQGSRIRKG